MEETFNNDNILTNIFIEMIKMERQMYDIYDSDIYDINFEAITDIFSASKASRLVCRRWYHLYTAICQDIWRFRELPLFLNKMEMRMQDLPHAIHLEFQSIPPIYHCIPIYIDDIIHCMTVSGKFEMHKSANWFANYIWFKTPIANQFFEMFNIGDFAFRCVLTKTNYNELIRNMTDKHSAVYNAYFHNNNIYNIESIFAKYKMIVNGSNINIECSLYLPLEIPEVYSIRKYKRGLRFEQMLSPAPAIEDNERMEDILYSFE
jgi:hypothetical protein